jgi:hypothetical protein
LQLWTYPNLFKKPGKELTDLLVVFRDDVLIFSDKSCSYPDTGDPTLDWQRWFRRAIAESAHQIHLAEQWLRNQPDRIFLNPKCTERLPLRLPDPKRLRIHRICVATGATERCRAATGRGSLAIDVGVVGDAAPFTIGRVTANSEWLHVFDETAVWRVLSELSTVTDVVNYLQAKTQLMDGGRFHRAASEADLLGHYLWHNRSFPPAGGPYWVVPDLWRSIETNARFQARQRANQVSAFWDGLIEYLTDHYLDSTLEFGNELDMNDYEKMVRIMASEPRFHRRILSKAILERAERARDGWIGSMLPSDRQDVVYALLIGPGAPRTEYAKYRERRSQELQLRCVAAKAARPEFRYVVGIGLDARGVDGSAEDFVLIDTIDWTDEILAGAARVRQELGYYLQDQATATRVEEEEYPRA